MKAIIVAALLFGASAPVYATQKTAIFAGGCFWCMQASFDFLKKRGEVEKVVVGYTGGTKVNPTYKEIATGKTGHREAIEVTYDPKKISYERLLEFFWSNVDPVDATGQFCDKGEQYTSAIFYSSPEEKKAAEKSMGEYAKKMKIRGAVATAIIAAKPFYAAEEYHQDFYLKNPERYEEYVKGCRRYDRLEEVWGKKQKL